MTGFLTVEDCNTALYSQQEYWWHEIDTSNITTDEKNYSNVKYDFCIISRSKVGSTYTFTVKVENSKWSGGYYCNGSTTVNGNTNTITIETSSKNVIVYLYFGNTHYTNKTGTPWAPGPHPEGPAYPKMIFYLDDIKFSLKYNELASVPYIWQVRESVATQDRIQPIEPVTPDYHLNPNLHYRGYLTNANIGNNQITKQVRMGSDGIYQMGFIYIEIIKTDFEFNCTQSLVVGKINKVYLGTDSKYKPSGSMVGSYTTNITVDYNCETLPVSYDGTDYYFNLDLTNETEAKKVKFTVNVEANEVLNKSSTDVVLKSQYQTVNTFSALLSAVSISEIIQLGANMTATSNIPINRSIKIIGNGKSIDLNGYRFVLVEDVEFKVENLQLHNGDTTIIQAKNTKVELTGVTFNNCTSSNYNGLGSCIFCDVDIDSLDNTDDYITTLTECTFTDNANCILHGGDLTIQKCTLDNDTITNINPNNCAFVYQTDGTCLIQQSIFNINYDYTSAEANIGFAQALVMCGETANINGATHTDLQEDNTLPFFDAPFNNRADLTAKYYYPQITDNVESVGSVSGKACCHACSGVDWVFKNNVTVRRSE